MENIEFEKRLNRRLEGEARQELEKDLLPMMQWKSRMAEMPPECRNVVTGDAFYAGCEGIGYSEKVGWFLVLWEPTEEPPVNSFTGAGPLKVAAQVCGGPTKADPGVLTLIYAQNEPVAA